MAEASGESGEREPDGTGEAEGPGCTAGQGDRTATFSPGTQECPLLQTQEPGPGELSLRGQVTLG